LLFLQLQDVEDAKEEEEEEEEEELKKRFQYLS
jgi:hypothetical protein